MNMILKRTSYRKRPNQLLGFFFALAAFTFMSSPFVHAQDKKEERRFENYNTTKVKAISPGLAKKLQPVRDFLSPEVKEGETPPEPDAPNALKAINRVDASGVAGHEKAEIWNYYGYIYFLLDEPTKARDYYTRVVTEPEANGPLRTRTLKTVAQLCMIDADWDCALSRLQEWMSLQEILGARDYGLLANIYYNASDSNNALINAEKAIEIRESAGEIGEEQWYGIQRAVYYERKDFPRVIAILKKLIVNYPKTRYWSELGGMYGEMEDTENQMNAFVLTYLQGGLTSEGQLKGLAYMYIGADAPYKGAQVLIEALDAGKIPRSERNLQLVGSAYYQAFELEKALPYMEEAAKKATSGETYGRLASIYLDLERFDDAVRTGTEAIRRGELKQPHFVRLGLGTAYFNNKKYSDAIRVFRQIKKDEPGYEAAQNWIKYVGTEQRREQQLRDSGIDLDKILG